MFVVRTSQDRLYGPFENVAAAVKYASANLANKWVADYSIVPLNDPDA